MTKLTMPVKYVERVDHHCVEYVVGDCSSGEETS
jgi:hypothetical protein